LSSPQNTAQLKKHSQHVFPFNATVSFDPPRDGNCQFASVAYHLNSCGVSSGATQLTVRAAIVDFLNGNPHTPDEATHLCNFVTNAGNGNDWLSYLNTMKANHTFGDHITLYAAAKLFAVQFIVLSSVGVDATVFVSGKSVGECTSDDHVVFLGHFAETDSDLVKEHYVCLSLSSNDKRDVIQFLLQKQGSRPASVTTTDVTDKFAVSDSVGPSAPLLDYPRVWSVEQWLRWTDKHPWLQCKNEMVGCSICSEIPQIALDKRGVHVSR